MNKQTALQWFKDVSYPYLDKESKEYIDILFNHALQMEREQIEQAYTCGDVDSFGRIHHPEHYKYKSAYKYYNERYGGQDE